MDVKNINNIEARLAHIEAHLRKYSSFETITNKQNRLVAAQVVATAFNAKPTLVRFICNFVDLFFLDITFIEFNFLPILTLMGLSSVAAYYQKDTSYHSWTALVIFYAIILKIRRTL